jgi:hypothetical protein
VGVLGDLMAYRAQEGAVEPGVTGQLGVEGEAPHESGSNPDDLHAPERECLRPGAHTKDPGGPNEDPRKQRSAQTFDADRGLERLALPSVVIPSYPYVEYPERRRVSARRARFELSREEDQSSAGGENGQPLGQPPGQSAP